MCRLRVGSPRASPAGRHGGTPARHCAATEGRASPLARPLSGTWRVPIAGRLLAALVNMAAVAEELRKETVVRGLGSSGACCRSWGAPGLPACLRLAVMAA